MDSKLYLYNVSTKRQVKVLETLFSHWMIPVCNIRHQIFLFVNYLLVVVFILLNKKMMKKYMFLQSRDLNGFLYM